MIDKLNEITKLVCEIKEELESKSDNKINFYEKNGIRYFKKNGIEWAEFKENTFVTVDVLSVNVINEIVDDKRYTDCVFGVRYNNDIFDNSWDNSFIRKILNNKFKDNYLNNLELDEEVRLLTADEAKILSFDLRETSSHYYWTMSPDCFNDGYAYVFAVNSYGDFYSSDGCCCQLNSNNVDDAIDVRPVIKIKGDL